MMTPNTMYTLTEEMVDEVIHGLKVAGMVNITWGKDGGMLCGNPLLERAPLLDVSCSSEEQAWTINRAKAAISRGDEATARRHLAPLVRKPLH
jgi:hypothetical protein